MLETSVPRRKAHRTVTEDRLTVSLAPGQREALESVAEQNNVKLAFVVRRALTEFIEGHRDKQQLQLAFPHSPPPTRGRDTASDGEHGEMGEIGRAHV